MVYFNYYNVMLNADIQSFKVLESKVGNVSKDKKYVYFRDKIVEEVDAETFVFLENASQENIIGNVTIHFMQKTKTIYIM